MDEGFMKQRPLLPLLVSMSLPMVLSMLVSALYNIVDSLFVARISEHALTALSLVFPVQNLINAVAIGFGVGVNAVVAFHLGAGEQRAADAAATHSFVFCALHGVLLTAASIAVMPGFLRMFAASAEVVALGLCYARIAFAFSTVNMFNLFFEKVFQAAGQMIVPMLGLLCGCGANILLDPVLIFGLGGIPALGIAGAALATGLGQCITLCVYLAAWLRCPPPVRLRRCCLAPDRRIDARLYAVGIPATLNLALPSLLVSALNGLLAGCGQSYVVVLGVYYKLQTFLYLPVNGVVQAVRPIVGYNLGAGRRDRVQKAAALTLALSAGVLALGTAACQLAAGPLIGLFTQNPDTLAAGQTALRIISAGFVVSAVSVTAAGVLEGLGAGAASLAVSLCRYTVILLPAAFLLCRAFGAVGVWHAFWVSEAVSAVLAAFIYRRAVQKTHARA